MNQKISTGVGAIILIIISITAGVFVWKYYQLNPVAGVLIPAPIKSEKRACTMEAMLCPDGSYVSRSGPNCEFAACPGESVVDTSNPAPSGVERVCTMEAMLCPDGSSVGRSGPNCEFAACPSESAINTSDWQTYRNEKYGFEFKYPADWQISNENEEVSSGNIWVVIVQSKDEAQSFAVRRKSNNPEEDQGFILDSTMKQQININGTEYFANIYPDGYEVYGDEIPDDNSVFYLTIEKNDFWYILQGDGGVKNGVSDIDKKILSTFKFIN